MIRITERNAPIPVRKAIVYADGISDRMALADDGDELGFEDRQSRAIDHHSVLRQSSIIRCTSS
jgi:hypothetical protein